MIVHDPTLPGDREPRLVLDAPKRPRGRPNKAQPAVSVVAVKQNSLDTYWHALPSQAEFLQAIEPEVMASGGYASGKTSALLVSCVQSVSGRPLAKSLLARRYMVGLKKTTLPMLLKPSGEMPAILPPGSYEYLETKDLIRVFGGGEICLGASDQPIKIMSLNCGDLFVDEAVEMEDYELYSGLLSRIRITTGSGFKRLCTNPATRSHWLWNYFQQSGRKIIYSDALSNPHITAEYRAWLSDMKGDERLRKCLGQWTARGVMIWPEWNPTTMVQTQTGEEGEWMLAIDYGQTHATGIIACRMTSDGVMHIHDELYGPGKTFREIIAWCKKFDKYRPTIIYDPSARSIKTEFEAVGMTAVPADNDVGIGIARVSDRMGAGLLEVDPCCRYLMSEIVEYAWDQRPGHEGKPVKEKDDLCDPLRYACLEASRSLASNQSGSFIFA